MRKERTKVIPSKNINNYPGKIINTAFQNHRKKKFRTNNDKTQRNIAITDIIGLYNSTNGAMTLEATYKRIVPYYWLAGFSTDWHKWVCIALAPN